MEDDLTKLKPYQGWDEEEEWEVWDEEEPLEVKEPAIVYGNPAYRYSYADYLTWMDDKRRELIDGIVRLMEGVSFRHCDLTLELAFRLKNFIKRKKGKCHVFSSPVDVCLPKGEEKEDDKIYTVLQPDVFVVCDLSKLQDERRCMGAPDLVVEILSKSTSHYDLTKKFKAYQEAGVREYWVVYQRPKRITVFTLQKNGLFDAGIEYRAGDVLISSVLQGLSIDIDLLYADASS